MLKADGFDDCILGITERFGASPVIAYDRDKMISKMVEDDDMEWHDAEEYFIFNILGAWVGEGTPCFVSREAWYDYREVFDEQA